MPFTLRPHVEWRLRTRSLALSERTRVMGILNLSGDSFSGDGVRAVGEAVTRALRMLHDGADLLDLGAESTRPGSARLSTTEEQDRLLPALEALRRERPHAIVSVDTYHAETARAALLLGAEIVNDVSGFLWDPPLADVCARAKCGVVLMHTRGHPHEWRTLPMLAPHAVVPLVLGGLGERLAAAQEAGVDPERIVLDPGYGFGKAFDANYSLLAGQDTLLALRRPLLAGVSRKSFLGRTLGALRNGPDTPAHEREHATIAASVAAILNGASLLRVHTVRPAVEAAAIADAVLAG